MDRIFVHSDLLSSGVLISYGIFLPRSIANLELHKNLRDEHSLVKRNKLTGAGLIYLENSKLQS